MSDGTVVYQYKDEDLRQPTGVCVDGGGIVIACCLSSHSVKVIRADGTKCCTLIASQVTESRTTLLYLDVTIAKIFWNIR